MKTRISALQQRLTTDALLIENPVDLLYLTGLSLSKGVFVLTKHESCLFVDGRYIAVAQNTAAVPVVLLEKNSVSGWCSQHKVKTLGFDSAWTTVEQLEVLNTYAEKLVPVSKPCKPLRVVKEVRELTALRKAADLTWAGLQHVLGLLREGITELELAWAFETYVRTHGASGLSFEPIVAFGKNSAFPHHRAGNTKLQKNDLVLIDVGAIVDSYRGDLTRVHSFGSPDPKLLQMLEWTKQAQAAALQKVKPGARVEELDVAARAVFARHGVEPLFSHGLGHGIGLETHEFPSIKKSGPDAHVKLEAGMVFTLEPGLYQPGLGGVRWEDIVLVTATGVERLYP